MKQGLMGSGKNPREVLLTGSGIWYLSTVLITIVTWGEVSVVPVWPSQVVNPLQGGCWSTCGTRRKRQVLVIKHIPGAVLCTWWQGCYIPVPTEIPRELRATFVPFHKWRISNSGTWPARQLVKRRPDLAPKVNGYWVQERPLWLQWAAFLV